MKKIITCLAALLLTLTGCSALAQSVTVTFYDMGKADAALVTTETGARRVVLAGEARIVFRGEINEPAMPEAASARS